MQQKVQGQPTKLTKSVSIVQNCTPFFLQIDGISYLISHLNIVHKGSHKWDLNPDWVSGQSSSGTTVTVSLYNISPALWGQSGSEIGRIGVIVHELGHFMGAPDMYDTNGGTLWLHQRLCHFGACLVLSITHITWFLPMLQEVVGLVPLD